jgi:hypothetical protein
MSNKQILFEDIELASTEIFGKVPGKLDRF